MSSKFNCEWEIFWGPVWVFTLGTIMNYISPTLYVYYILEAAPLASVLQEKGIGRKISLNYPKT